MPAARLIGRDKHAALLREELRRTTSSHGGLVLVTGEAGIGKTALLTEVVGDLCAQDALVLTATAWCGEGTPGFWPWVQVVRGLRRAATPEQWAAVDAAAGNALSYLIGEAELPKVAQGVLFRIADAVTEALVAACALRPVIVVIDDLHRADPESLTVLAFVARHSWFERLTIVAAVRDNDIAAADHPLRAAFAELSTAARVIELTGLALDQVAEFVRTTTGASPPAAIAETVHKLSGGNPFLVEQVARLWQTGSTLDTLTPGVRETLDARLTPLPAAALDVLTTAALLGREFAAPVAAAGAGRELGQVLDLAELAVRARLLTAPGAQRYAFVHDLVRETLISRLDGAEARRRHAAVLGALERLPREVSGATRGELAHHAYLAADAVDPGRTLRYLLEAAADACGRLAAGEVAVHYHRALTLLPEDQAELRGTVGLNLAAAQSGSGELAAARRTYEALLTTAGTRGAAGLFAEAALGLHELGMPDPEHQAEREIALMDQAYRMLLAERCPADPLAVRVRAAATRVRVHTGRARHGAVDHASAETVRAARESGDESALAAALLARHDAIWRPGTAAERLSLAGELADIGRREHGDELELQGTLLRFTALLELGDPAAHTELAAFGAHADRARLLRFRFVALSRTGALATLTGRFAAAREAIDDAYALGERLGEVDLSPLWLEQRWALALLAGDLAEAESFVQRYRDAEFAYTAVPELITAARRGDLDRVRGRVGDIQAMYDRHPRHFHPSILIAQACAALALDDPELRETVRARLVPLADWWAVVAGGGAVYGPYAYWLGRLAAAAGEHDAAVDYLDAAAKAAHRLRARPWVDAARHRLRLLAHREHRTPQAPITPPDNEFRLDGDVWTLRYAERTVHLPDAKGLRDLHVLLGHRDSDIPSLELFGTTDPSGAVRAAKAFGADPVLDDAAKAAYHRRLTTLDDEIDRAAGLGRDDRAAELDRERAALLDELRRTAGLAGRTRHLGDDAERARKTVSARVRDTLRRIDRVHPELAEHLRATVSLGILCRYQPQREIVWRL
ncbi:AAA family ATPase [Nocardia brasiliensis]|uniref:AAA family ATPase n=1 Tax=Nocardia brasiliensis TaxID=37326 RepID=A0A6G9XRR6_NOCBR|nr:AAA family ATPase [Nocardia brasiliensis]QIS03607.1 AAA family ATPase [Nocardia brasiliensis]